MQKKDMIKLEIVLNINGQYFLPAYFEKFAELDGFVRKFISFLRNGEDLCFIASRKDGIDFIDSYFSTPVSFMKNTKLVGVFLNKYDDSHKSFKWEQVECQ